MTYPSERPTLLNKKTVAIAFAALIILLGILFVGRWLFGELALGLVLVVGFGILMAIALESYYRLYDLNYRQSEQIQALLEQHDRRQKDYQQIEALFSLIPLLNLRHPLPSMRDWAASPDFLALIVSLIREHRPQLVVEASSGVSTLVSAYSLEAISLEAMRLAAIADSTTQTQVISLEHESEYAIRNRNQIEQHGLQAIAKILDAPLETVSINQQEWFWYRRLELASLMQNTEKRIELLIIDGPPKDTQKLARYPALPLLWEWLSDEAIVLLDDADREDEREIVRRWQQEYSGKCRIDAQWIATEKGACILRIKKLSS
ncbi:class I SAM-dependent methyltransferase [Leptolyngbya ohadii]|uniref:class I SAM-dependent methyltransferase n=1 Tax=Leptolyngbya ohadii TaxID=1962290 RepID=UPI0015C644F4|nr:class I SAM-dependent methyltransferase [Leptolyngbya ohadii]